MSDTDKTKEQLIQELDTLRQREEELIGCCDQLEELLNTRTAELQQKITERKQLKKTLRENEQRLALTLTGSDLGEWELDVKTKSFIVGERRVGLLGYTLDEIGTTFPIDSWVEWIHPDDRAQALHEIQDYLSMPTIVFETEHRIRTKSGEWRWYLNRGRIVERDEDGAPLRAVGVTLDIHERKQLQKQVLELALEQERAQILSSFIAQASHEFRTPLTIINAGAHILTQSTDPAVHQRHILNIKEQVRNLTQLVEALNTLTTLGSIRKVTTEEVDLCTIVEAIHTTLRETTLQSKNIDSVLALKVQSLLVHANIIYLQQAIEVIVENAIRFTPEGGTLTLRIDRDDNNAIIEITDTGTGINEDDLPHIFERFYRADKVGTTRGFGLGLPIARAIIELHQGRIAVQSEVGAGSTFRILLPVT